MKTKTIILTFILLFGYISSKAQVREINISVDGFTCSLCAKGVEGQFKALDFVSGVKTNLEAASFDLKFKPGRQIQINKIWTAVDDGGFTVGSISLDASGILVASGGNYILQTGNSPDLKLTNVTGDFKDGDKVSVKGTITTTYSVSVFSIKKL